MNISYAEAVVVVVFLHFLVDLNQGEWVAKEKCKGWVVMWMHGFYYAMAMGVGFVLAGKFFWGMVPIVLFNHIMLDLHKCRQDKDEPDMWQSNLFIDQTFHIGIIITMLKIAW